MRALSGSARLASQRLCPGPGVKAQGSRCAEEALRTRSGGDADDGCIACARGFARAYARACARMRCSRCPLAEGDGFAFKLLGKGWR